MKQKIIIGNWKMNKTISEAKTFIENFKKQLETNKGKINGNLKYGIASSFTSLSTFSQKKSENFILASQNVFYEPKGAFTGEVSIEMLKELNVTHVIVGHSERRMFFEETNQLINKKVHSLLNNNLVPVFCCGENLSQYENNQTEKVITKQIQEGLKNVTSWDKVIIAYEPIWAIGTGKTASPEDAQKVCALIRELTNDQVTIQYGGSVKPDNIENLLFQKDIDGALVGGASLDSQSFFDLLKNASKTFKEVK